ncbi:hypothetical protein DWUX_2146 [Desulfovibrio diazotrophicus]|nr:hypothetical protein DWUX_2146 [Desulfovibrio diazotrophicus]
MALYPDSGRTTRRRCRAARRQTPIICAGKLQRTYRIL